MKRLASFCAAVLIVLPVAAAEIAVEQKRSGSSFMSPEARALQGDDSANPAMLFVRDGEDLWNRPEGRAQKSCADCHGEASASMRGVAARYPAFDAASGQPVTLAQRINLCRQNHQNAAPLAPEAPQVLALAAYTGIHSRAMAIAPPQDLRLAPFLAEGLRLYSLRQGQLNLSCGNCHDDNWERKLGGSPITQGQATGYPLYRLEWQGMGSLQRRIRNCMAGVRAEPYATNSAEMVDLELYLAARARGLAAEIPAVRP